MGSSQALRRLLSALAALALGCAGHAAREADRAYTAGMAGVERVTVELVSVSPPRLRIDVSGHLPDACTEIEHVEERRMGSRIELRLPTRRPAGSDCDAEPTPFKRSIPLSVAAGFDFYVVDVSGVVSTVWVRREPGAPDPGERRYN